MDLKIMLEYTEALSRNNDRSWFHNNHAQYERATDDFLVLLTQLKYALMQEAPELGDAVMFTNPKAFMYRIPRDMRIGGVKEPYNPSFRAYLSPLKKELLPLSYYIRIAHDGCFIETGVWPWTSGQLSTLRSYIALNYEELELIVAENSLKIYGERLKRAPRGYDETHPAVEWLKYKAILTSCSFTPEDMRDFDTLTDAAAAAMRRFEPLRRFLSEAYTAPTDEEDLFLI